MPQEDTVESLQEEQRLLELQLQRARLRAELAAQESPWWRRVGAVTKLAAMLATVIPVTTAIHAYFQERRVMQLEAAEQLEAIRVSYLDRLRDQSTRLRTLRFIVATTTDAALRAWAREEKAIVEAETARLREEIEAQQARTEATQRLYLDTLAKNPELATGLAAEVDAERRTLRRLQTQLRAPVPEVEEDTSRDVPGS